ncbi:MAG TPA: carboxypeptidase-like regulatory domain-containing protein [Bryobacteraceae bacterium]|nr:carboxypeptidase-like regulatory domain-containing protein [Bryobacteraceae bacterium]
MTRTRTGKLASRALLAIAVGTLLSQAAGEDKKQSEAYAVVSGTVFRENGMSFPGVEVALEAAPGSQIPKKFKKMRTSTSPRGEFVFRLPAEPGEYRLRVRVPGYETQEKPVIISGEDRIEVFFKLDPASK